MTNTTSDNNHINIELMKHQAIISESLAMLHAAQYKHAVAQDEFQQFLGANNLTVNESGVILPITESNLED
ncbi:hypothetical protein ABEL47_01700 [Escherichia coli]